MTLPAAPALREAVLRRGRACYLYDCARIEPAQLPALFTPGSGGVERIGGGRAAVAVRRHDDIDYVVRHYRRGGVLARFSGDRYLWNGLRFSRPWREWRLLARLYAAGLPVPRPLAVKLERHGLVYRADLATARLPHARTLAAGLRERPAGPAAWRALGALLRRFHDHGVCHADLNANNILRDAAGGWWLIDFDKARRRRPGRWRAGNLARLRRSLRKLADVGTPLYFSAADWRCLLDAYAAASGSPHSTARRDK